MLRRPLSFARVPARAALRARAPGAYSPGASRSAWPLSRTTYSAKLGHAA